MSQPKRITIKDIARESGFSVAAVSQALRPRSNSNIKLNAGTSERIRQTARDLNYQPHSGARSIRSNSFHAIGYFAAKTTLMTNTPAGYLAGIHDIAEAHQYRLNMIRFQSRKDEIGKIVPNIFSERNLDALIIESYNELAHQIFEQIEASRLPIVFINDRHEYNSVYVDDVWAASELTRHVHAKGYEDICFLQRRVQGGPTVSGMHHSAADRAKGYRAAMRKLGLTSRVHTVLTEDTVGLDVKLRENDWQTLSQHRAVIAYDDDLANLVARSAYDRGLRIPDALAVAGFNGDYASLSAWQHLTTMRIPSYEMGSKAGEMVFELLAGGPETRIASSIHRPTLISGQTT
jgi:LacI family transcriptional regulator